MNMRQFEIFNTLKDKFPFLSRSRKDDPIWGIIQNRDSNILISFYLERLDVTSDKINFKWSVEV